MPPVISGGEIVTAGVIYSPPHEVNALNSAFYYLSGSVFSRQVGGASGTLAFHYPLLKIRADFPEDLSKTTLPLWALTEDTGSPPESFVFGSPGRTRRKLFTLHGFAGSYKDHQKNKWERSLMFGDALALLDEARIPIYDFSSGTSVTFTGYGDVTLIATSPTPPSEGLAAERSRFQISFQLEY